MDHVKVVVSGDGARWKTSRERWFLPYGKSLISRRKDGRGRECSAIFSDVRKEEDGSWSFGYRGPQSRSLLWMRLQSATQYAIRDEQPVPTKAVQKLKATHIVSLLEELVELGKEQNSELRQLRGIFGKLEGWIKDNELRRISAE